jgi:hypothetical protein
MQMLWCEVGQSGSDWCSVYVRLQEEAEPNLKRGRHLAGIVAIQEMRFEEFLLRIS